MLQGFANTPTDFAHTAIAGQSILIDASLGKGSVHGRQTPQGDDNIVVATDFSVKSVALL
jgi:hypothetical protein